MGDNAERPERGAREPEPAKIKAEDNPWYLLATLYGVPEPKNLELFAENRRLWNHCLASFLDRHELDTLIKSGKYTEAELEPVFPIRWRMELGEKLIQRAKNQAQSRAVEAWFSSFQWTTQKMTSAQVIIPKIDFSNAEFDRDVSFHGYLFSIPVYFSNAKFSEFAGFQNSIFFRGGHFDGAFFNEARFDSAEFYGGAFFQSTEFDKAAVFKDATFWYPEASFEGAIFRFADFSGAAFNKGANFNDSTMKAKTLFKGAKFPISPPQFFNARLHEGTVWPDHEAWPLPNGKDKAQEFIQAYARLKLEMDRLKKHEDELDFFALELQSRRVLVGWRGWPIRLYGFLSRYGRSYLRPLVGIIVVAAIGAWVFWYFDARTCGEALGLSAANTLSVFGFRRDFGLAIDTPFASLEAMSAVQTIFGTIFLFLFGLGVRNKFRMK